MLSQIEDKVEEMEHSDNYTDNKVETEHGIWGRNKKITLRITGEFNTLKDKIHKLILLYSAKLPVTKKNCL